MKLPSEEMELNNPMIVEFMKMGSTSRREAAVAHQIYLELTEVKKYRSVDYFFSKLLERIYFTARMVPGEEPAVFIPVAVPEGVSFTDIQELLGAEYGVPVACRVFAAMVDNDSTSVYYQFTSGAHPPRRPAPRAPHNQQSQQVDAEIKQNEELLEEAALCGAPVTLPPAQSQNPGNPGGSNMDN